MKSFESNLAAQLNAYIRYRVGQGCSEKSIRAPLVIFDKYLTETGCQEHPIQPAFLLKMRNALKQDPKTVNNLLSALRGFFLFLVRQEIYDHSPVEDIPALPVRVYVPFVFSPDQIELLLQAASRSVRKTKAHLLRDMATYLVVVLLARCGMRLREPLRLRIEHYRPGEGTLYIEKTKFSKDRLIPVPKRALQEIENYLAARQALLADDSNPYLLAGLYQSHLPVARVTQFFHEAAKAIGIEKQEHVLADVVFGSVRPHALRHSFAINTMKRIREQGKDPQHALPVLAAYLGHREYKYTAAYLKVLDQENRQGLVDFAKSRQDRV
jgi:integrase/recombinase XerD